MSFELITLAVLLQVKHWYIDFANQTKQEIANKGIYGNMIGMTHSIKHGIGTLLCILSITGQGYFLYAFILALIDFIFHYHIDYVKMAYALAMSIKLTQKEVNNITLITDIPEAVPEHYRNMFDQVLPIKWYDDAFESEWKIENRWKLYHLSPYDETVVLDADMLFLSDVSQWWNYMSKNFDLLIADKVSILDSTVLQKYILFANRLIFQNQKVKRKLKSSR